MVSLETHTLLFSQHSSQRSFISYSAVWVVFPLFFFPLIFLCVVCLRNHFFKFIMKYSTLIINNINFPLCLLALRDKGIENEPTEGTKNLIWNQTWPATGAWLGSGVVSGMGALFSLKDGCPKGKPGYSKHPASIK